MKKNIFCNINKIINKYIRRLGIKKRLMITFLIISVLPISLLGFVSSISALKEMEYVSQNYSLNVTEHIVNNISFFMDKYTNKFERIVLNQTILDDVYNFGVNKYYEKFDIENRMWRNLTSIIGFDEGINTVEICTSQSKKFYMSSPITKGDAEDSSFIQDTLKSENIVWRIGRKEAPYDPNIYIILGKRMKMQLDENVIGFAHMAINRTYIDKMCQQNIVGNQYVVLTNQEGIIISHPDYGEILQKFDKKILDKIDYNEKQREQNIGDDNNNFKIKTNKGVFLVSYGILEKNNWRVINVIPYSELMQGTINQVIVTIIIAAMYIIFSLYFSIIVTASIHEPLNKLIVNMKKLGNGNLDIFVMSENVSINDEYIQLAKGFNNMISRLRNLINDVYKSELKKKELEYSKKEAELNSLQQQINPHFLYNTLESIYWSAQLKGDEEISEIVSALGDFFRANISKGLEFITIEQEVINVKNYIYLQKIRFNERLVCIWDIQEEVLQYKTIKLILQPIIENAIVHSIEKLEQNGLLTICIWSEDEKVIFEITDNGIGIQEQKVTLLQQHINNINVNNIKSVDIKNVNQRIRLYFGKKYGINIKSKFGKGTIVRISIPIIE